MTKEEILEDLEEIQISIDKIGFKGQNEYDLHIRENVADYIISQLSEKNKEIEHWKSECDNVLKAFSRSEDLSAKLRFDDIEKTDFQKQKEEIERLKSELCNINPIELPSECLNWEWAKSDPINFKCLGVNACKKCKNY